MSTWTRRANTMRRLTRTEEYDVDYPYAVDTEHGQEQYLHWSRINQAWANGFIWQQVKIEYIPVSKSIDDEAQAENVGVYMELMQRQLTDDDIYDTRPDVLRTLNYTKYSSITANTGISATITDEETVRRIVNGNIAVRLRCDASETAGMRIDIGRPGGTPAAAQPYMTFNYIEKSGLQSTEGGQAQTTTLSAIRCKTLSSDGTITDGEMELHTTADDIQKWAALELETFDTANKTITSAKVNTWTKAYEDQTTYQNEYGGVRMMDRATGIRMPSEMTYDTINYATLGTQARVQGGILNANTEWMAQQRTFAGQDAQGLAEGGVLMIWEGKSYEVPYNSGWMTKDAQNTHYKLADMTNAQGKRTEVVLKWTTSKRPWFRMCSPSPTANSFSYRQAKWYIYVTIPAGAYAQDAVLRYSADNQTWTELDRVQLGISGGTNGISQGVWLTAQENSIQPGTAYIAIWVNGNDGTRATWSKTYTAVENSITAQTISPKMVYINGENPITMQWQMTDSAGGAQDAFEIQATHTPDDEATWETVFGDMSSDTTATLQKNALPSGVTYWRAHVTTADGNNADSDVAQIIVLHTPKVKNAYATPSPRMTITWECNDQEAYEVTISAGGTQVYASGPKHGRDQEHTAPIWLNDGLYTARVRVQNRLGRWSEWAQAQAWVNHEGAGGIMLTASDTYTGGQNVPELTWTAEGAEYTAYEVERDAKRIATVRTNTFVDEYAGAGEHQYRIRGVRGNDYTMSNEAEYTQHIRGAMIAAVPEDGGYAKWIQIGLGTEAKRTVTHSTQHSVTLSSYAGRALPVAEKGTHRSGSFKTTAAVQSLKMRHALEDMMGKEVVYKRRERVIHGVMSEITAAHDQWKYDGEYTITIIETDAGEAIF